MNSPTGPDTAWTWRHLGPYLAERGHRVVAPFLRGYAPSGLADSYHVGALMADAVALHAELGGDERTVLVGHDWGCLLSLRAASLRPDLLRSVAAGNGPIDPNWPLHALWRVWNQVGELVLTAPMPCMPVGFWNDPDHSRFRKAYFEHFPGDQCEPHRHGVAGMRRLKGADVADRSPEG